MLGAIATAAGGAKRSRVVRSVIKSHPSTGHDAAAEFFDTISWQKGLASHLSGMN